MRIPRVGLVVLLFAGACGSNTPKGSRQAVPAQRDLITHEEIIASTHDVSDLYRAIQSLRPHFLAPPRGINSSGSSASFPTEVYVDGRRQIGLDALRSLPAASVEEVKYLNPTASISELGPRASGGAVMVTLRKP